MSASSVIFFDDIIACFVCCLCAFLCLVYARCQEVEEESVGLEQGPLDAVQAADVALVDAAVVVQEDPVDPVVPEGSEVPGQAAALVPLGGDRRAWKWDS